jgi:chemotaxis signal transduction protein
MTAGDDRPAAGGSLPAPGEALVRVRGGAFHLLLPLAAVERVLPAALPAVRPEVEPDAAPVVAVAGDLLPVLFAEALLGEPAVRLRPEDQLLLLRQGAQQALLWVSAVEEVLPCQPRPPPPGGRGQLLTGWSGLDDPLAVLDVGRAVALANGALEAP